MTSQSETPLIAARDLVRVYREGKVTALDHVTLEIQRGEYVAIMGPSGCGKSTLLNLLGSLDRPTSGDVYFEGQPLSGLSDLAAFRARKIGFVFQSFHLIPVLTAAQNVQIPMFESDYSAADRAVQAMRLLERVHLQDRATHRPSELSGGERQRVAIARALANEPPLLLADEPTGNLDSKSADEILDLFRLLHGQGMTLVVITHDPHVAAQAQRVIRMKDGRLTAPSHVNG